MPWIHIRNTYGVDRKNFDIIKIYNFMQIFRTCPNQITHYLNQSSCRNVNFWYLDIIIILWNTFRFFRVRVWFFSKTLKTVRFIASKIYPTLIFAISVWFRHYIESLALSCFYIIVRRVLCGISNIYFFLILMNKNRGTILLFSLNIGKLAR